MKRKSFYIANKVIGNGSVLIQSMSDIKTSHVRENIKLTEDLAKRGLDLMRFSVLDREDAKALHEIKESVSIPVIADIHFDSTLAVEAILSGADKIRINPGNIPLSSLREIISLCKERQIPIRIGVNSGSLNRYKGKGKDHIDDFFLALEDTLQIFKEENFDLLVLSLKTSNPDLLFPLYQRAYETYPYPLHIGLTEAGLLNQGLILSAIPLYQLLKEGIGDTIRISLASDRKEEVRACKTLLKAASRREKTPTLIVCPGCGRTLVEHKRIAEIIQEHLDFVDADIKVACMGCPVNGIGEAKDADFGITGSGVKDDFILFSHEKILLRGKEEDVLNRLFSLIESEIIHG